jgi:hypothetical protein
LIKKHVGFGLPGDADVSYYIPIASDPAGMSSLPSPIKNTSGMRRPLQGHSKGRWGPAASGSFSTANPKGMIATAVHARAQVPGSGKYRPKRVRKKVGVKFSTSFPKNDVDWRIYHAKQTPGPGQFSGLDSAKKATRYKVGHSGKFNQSMPANDVEIMCRKARAEPGPSEYSDYSFKKDRCVGNGRFSSSVLPTFSDVQKNYTKDVPGPASYTADVVPRNRKSATGKISNNRVPGYIEHAINLRKANPSPQKYRPKDIRSGGEGRRFSNSNPKSDVDWSIYRAKAIPGPGQYALPMPIHSDVLRNRRQELARGGGGCIVHAPTYLVPEPKKADPVRTLQCFNGEIQIPLDTFEFFRAAGVVQRIKSMVLRNVRELCASVNDFPPHAHERHARKALQTMLSRVVARHGKSHRRSVVLTKLVACLLRESGQIEKAIELMSAAVGEGTGRGGGSSKNY